MFLVGLRSLSLKCLLSSELFGTNIYQINQNLAQTLTSLKEYSVTVNIPHISRVHQSNKKALRDMIWIFLSPPAQCMMGYTAWLLTTGCTLLFTMYCGKL